MEKEKRPHISRREVIKMTGAGALAAALGTGVLIPGRAVAAAAKARAVLFDVGGTILDWSAMPDKMTKYFSARGIKIDGKSFWLPWRAKLFSYMMYNTMIGSGFIPLEELAARATLAAARAQKIDLEPGVAAGVLPLLGELDVYPDIMPGLHKMRELGYKLVPHTQLSLGVLKKALLGRFQWDAYFTSETFGLYKPQRNFYLKAIDVLGLERSEIIYVTSNQFDIFGSKGMGFRTAWVNRWSETLEPYGDVPNWQVKDFVELAKTLEAEKP